MYNYKIYFLFIIPNSSDGSCSSIVVIVYVYTMTIINYNIYLYIYIYTQTNNVYIYLMTPQSIYTTIYTHIIYTLLFLRFTSVYTCHNSDPFRFTTREVYKYK